jgi:hypothetical protein
MARQDTIGKHRTTVTTRYPSTARNGEIAVRYHDTDVVTFYFDEVGPVVTLHDGGWRTRTTMLRMNQTSRQHGLGFIVRQRDFKWFVEYGGKVYDYYDGITF